MKIIQPIGNFHLSSSSTKYQNEKKKKINKLIIIKQRASLSHLRNYPSFRYHPSILVTSVCIRTQPNAIRTHLSIIIVHSRGSSSPCSANRRHSLLTTSFCVARRRYEMRVWARMYAHQTPCVHRTLIANKLIQCWNKVSSKSTREDIPWH